MSKKGIDICGKGSFSKGHPCHSDRGSYPSGHGNSRGGDGSRVGGGDSGSQSSGSGNQIDPQVVRQSLIKTSQTSPLSTRDHIQKFDSIIFNKHASAVIGYNATHDLYNAKYYLSKTGYVNLGVHDLITYAQNKGKDRLGKDALHNIKAITLYDNDLKDFDIAYMGSVLCGYDFNLEALYLGRNPFGDSGVHYLLNDVVTTRHTHSVVELHLPQCNLSDESTKILSYYMGIGGMPATKVLNLADNNITDTGAAYLAEGLKSEGNKLNIIHLEGNRLTSTGEGYLVKALLNKATQHMIIYTQSYKGQFDEHVRMIFGTREEKAAIYKKLIAQGVEKGVNAKEIVVDQTLYGEIINKKNLASTGIQTFWGFIKCNFDPIDMVKSYAANKIIAKLPKSIARLAEEVKEADDVVTCYFEAHNEAWTSEAGVNVLTHELCITGESGFCNGQ